ncbi:MAG: ATP-dependent DNA helicase RecG, partial [Firmicutes bacterium]|nr:ATP-dependent DNA helicase RecG [Bacillota bacterium]
MKLEDDITSVKNIGASRAEKLKKLNIFTVKDLIEYIPRDYDDRSTSVKINEVKINEVNTVKGVIMSKGENVKIKNITVTKIRLKDDSGFIELVWYNQPYMKNAFEYRGQYIVTGKVTNKYGRVQMASPEYEKIGDERELISSGRIVPIYHLTYKISQKLLRSTILSTLEEVKNEIADFMPESMRIKFDVCERRYAIENIHFPENNEAFFKARRRLVFEEFFILQTKLMQLRGNIKRNESEIYIEDTDDSELREKFPFKFTDAQEKVMNEIKNDLKSGYVMNRLIQGDVGSGKTVVAMAACYIAVKNGYQAALMAPTDVLASQHYESFTKIFNEMGIKCVLLLGNMKKSEKRRIYDSIITGYAKIIIGTHAVIQDAVKYDRLGLVITDEQHRFGVRQRSKLSEKGDMPHVIVMTATPIPRTLGLILYGDLDISVIDSLPPGRQKIDTIYVNSNYYERIYNFIKKNADEGRQAYIICPMIDESDNKELKSVNEYTVKLSEEIFKDYRVASVHGKMSSGVKQEIMSEFARGNIDILVSTTVIEVGINVANATIMLIENADRYGLAQLHQLRGRVGRGSEKSYCIMISDSKSKISKQR